MRGTARLIAAVVLVIGTGILTPMSTRSPDDPEACWPGGGSNLWNVPEPGRTRIFHERIAACTRAIDSGKYSGPKLADLYVMRAFQRLMKGGDWERARADNYKSIEIDPSGAMPVEYRSYT